jgi:hypothetical protein
MSARVGDGDLFEVFSQGFGLDGGTKTRPNGSGAK